MRKALTFHEIRDPIHVFVRLDSDECKVVNSPPFQRLRNIHQLALTYLLYPGATHRRFEHCLGVMELASKIYDTVTNPAHVHPEMLDLVPRSDDFHHVYWRRVVRLAALCHDLGHLPFSHAAEDLLPKGTKHESISKAIILSESMRRIWDKLKVKPEDVVKVAVGPKYSDQPLDTWESILYEIIGGDVFGADRMDYLLRDSYHAGVAYGRFDHFRLIDTLRILPKADFGPAEVNQMVALGGLPSDSVQDVGKSMEPMLGLEQGGVQSAEALLWARYFMYTQVYMHHVRRIYDVHLADFLRQWLPRGMFDCDPDGHLRLTDNEVMAAISAANRDPSSAGHEAAACIASRQHFRRIYETNPYDKKIRLDAFDRVHNALVKKFGDAHVRKSEFAQRSEGKNFPVLLSSGDCESSLNVSETLAKVPVFSVGYIYAHLDIRDEAKSWLRIERKAILGE
jgi:HD superfamily phosphohydrolase